MLGNDIFDYVHPIALLIFRQTKIKLEAVTMANNAWVQYTISDIDEVTRKEDRDKRIRMAKRKGLCMLMLKVGSALIERIDGDATEGGVKEACLIGKCLGET